MPLTVEQSARILHFLRYRSRRAAKAVAGDLLYPRIDGKRRHLKAEELDAILAQIAADPRIEEIEALTLKLHIENAAEDRPRRRGV